MDIAFSFNGNEFARAKDSQTFYTLVNYLACLRHLGSLPEALVTVQGVNERQESVSRTFTPSQEPGTGDIGSLVELL